MSSKTIQHGATGFVVALLAAVALTGCAGGGDDEAVEGTPMPTRAAGTPGKATCELLGTDGGTVTMTETADSYTIEFRGVPRDAADDRTTYGVQVDDDDRKSYAGMLMSWDRDVLRNYGTTDDPEADEVEVDGEPEETGDVVRGTFPKVTDGSATWWSPAYTTITDSGVQRHVCTEDGQVVPYTALDAG